MILLTVSCLQMQTELTFLWGLATVASETADRSDVPVVYRICSFLGLRSLNYSSVESDILMLSLRLFSIFSPCGHRTPVTGLPQ